MKNDNDHHYKHKKLYSHSGNVISATICDKRTFGKSFSAYNFQQVSEVQKVFLKSASNTDG